MQTQTRNSSRSSGIVMDPDNKNNSQDNEDQSTKHVLEYYQKFSQNKNLPKYFSGSPVSYLPEIKVPDVESEFTPKGDIVVTTNVDIIVTTVSDKEDDERNKDVSRASSAMSNRKLEWDNGADIGYDNCQKAPALFKSSSLPVLSQIKDQKVDFKLPQSDSKVKVIVFNYSSSEDSPIIKSTQSSTSSSPPPEQQVISSTTSTSLEKKQITSSATTSYMSSKYDAKTNSSSSSVSESKLSSFAATLLYLKEKIGVPEAHSTPKISEYRKSDSELVSPSVTKKKIKRTMLKESKTEPLVHVDKTKPPNRISKNMAESANKVEILRKKLIDKKIVNLALTEPITVECVGGMKIPKNKTIQTVIAVNTIGIQTDIIPPLELQNLISRHVNTNQSIMFLEHSEDDRRTECCTQTESDVVASNCDSFEYIKNNEKSPQTDKQIIQTEETALPVYDVGKLKRSQRVIDLNAVAESSESVNNEIGTFAKDVEKSIELLQKLLKSKNYDPKTKKKYMKKIIQKISNSKFLEDSSASSELFCPKKPKKTVQIETSDSSDPNNRKHWIESNTPWYPAHEQLKLSKYKQLNIKTLSEEIPPRSSRSSSSQPEIIPVESRHHSSKQFTLTNNEFVVNDPPSSSQKSTSLEKHHDSGSSKCYENWREDKTTSEKLLEVNRDSNNYLVDIAKKEKEYQLTWINNEINHLSKLKNLLEKDKTSSKRTTVYKVQSDKNEGRNYVIETDIGAKTSSNINFNLGGQKYSVEEINQKIPATTQHQVAGKIDVSVHDNVTNIRVKTFCQKCKRTPCICSERSSDNSSKSSQPSICLYCRRIHCVCSKRKVENASSSGYTGMFLPATYPPRSEKSEEETKKSKSVCSACGLLPCVCTNKRTVTSSELLRDYQALNSTGTNSLKRVFNNCKCSSQEDCTCNFVEKLVRHFKVASLPKTEHLQNIEVQTEEIATKHLQQFATQTDCNIQHIGIQSHKEETKTVSSQTSRQNLFEGKDKEIQGHIAENKDGKVQTSSVHIDNVKLQTSEPIKISTTTNEHRMDLQTNNVAQTQKSTIDENIQIKLSTLEVKTQTICDIISKPTQISKDTIELAQQTINKNQNVDTQSETLTFKNNIAQTARKTNFEGQTAMSAPKDDLSQTDGLKDNKTQVEVKQKAKYSKQKSTNTPECVCKKKNKQSLAKKTSEKIQLHLDESKFIETGTTYSYAGVGNMRSKDLQTEKIEMKDKDMQYIECNKNEENREKYSSNSSQINGTLITSETNTYTTTNSDKTGTETGYVYVHCMCCKERTPSETATALRSTNQTYHLCHHCIQRRPILTSLCYTSPQHICRCYDRSQYHYMPYCTCTKPSRVQDSRYCGHCKYKLRRTVKSKGGIAYTLTLENEPQGKIKSKKKKSQAKLEEIKIKVPNGCNRKKFKDKENYHRRGSVDRESENSGRNTNGSHDSNTSEKEDNERQYTLQEYLNQNRPDFIDSAEYRRNVVQSAKEQREDDKERVKLKFLEENTKKDPPEKSYKLFTEKEMREITKKNYKKLPEVQDRLNSQKEKRLRDADKMIKNVFTKKVQRNVLKGKRNFPIDTNIVSLPS